MTRHRAIEAVTASVALIAMMFVTPVAAQPAAGKSNHKSNYSGIASVYSYSAQRTASGERFQAGAMTAAHRTLPFGTLVRVTNRNNGRSVVVRINDRGPFVHGRVIDVTPAAAKALGFSGLVAVALDVVGREG